VNERILNLPGSAVRPVGGLGDLHSGIGYDLNHTCTITGQTPTGSLATRLFV